MTRRIRWRRSAAPGSPGFRAAPAFVRCPASREEKRCIPGRRSTMALWKPDPTFYPSPRLAMQAPQEGLAYVAAFNPKRDGRPDAMTVVDVAPGSPTYGQLVGRVEMPNAGDELHHFGWN